MKRVNYPLQLRLSASPERDGNRPKYPGKFIQSGHHLLCYSFITDLDRAEHRPQVAWLVPQYEGRSVDLRPNDISDGNFRRLDRRRLTPGIELPGQMCTHTSAERTRIPARQKQIRIPGISATSDERDNIQHQAHHITRNLRWRFHSYSTWRRSHDSQSPSP